jgi:hypothetical protein
MQSKKPRTTRGAPKKKAKRAKRGHKVKPGAVKGERLKPISLHGMDFDDVIRTLLQQPSGGVPRR